MSHAQIYPECCEQVCFTHDVKNPSAALNVNLKQTASLASLTLWADGADAPLYKSPAQLMGFSVSITDMPGGTMTGCEVGTMPMSDPSPAGYTVFPIDCGATGQYISIRYPWIAPSGFSIKVCVVTEKPGPAIAQLWLQSPP